MENNQNCHQLSGQNIIHPSVSTYVLLPKLWASIGAKAMYDPEESAAEEAEDRPDDDDILDFQFKEALLTAVQRYPALYEKIPFYEAEKKEHDLGWIAVVNSLRQFIDEKLTGTVSTFTVQRA